MEKQTLFTSQQLEDIFAQIKIGGKHGTNALYRGLVEDAVSRGAEMGIQRNDAIKIFNGIFSNLVKDILAGRLAINELEEVYDAIISKRYGATISKIQAVYATRTNITSNDNGSGSYYTESYMFMLNHLAELEKDAEIMAKHDITKQDIKVLKLYYAPGEGKLAKIAKAYNIELKEAQRLVRDARKKVDAINEVEFVR